MKYPNQSIWRVLTLVAFVVSFVNCIFAQQWVVDEIAEENEGGPFSGIIGAILLIGLIWLLGTIFGGNKKKESKKQSYKEDYSNDNLHDTYLDDDRNIDYMIDDIDDEPVFSSPVPSPRKASTTSTISTKPVKQQAQVMNEKDFKDKCIEIYGEYAENTYGLVLIKEDGEYRQISYPDKRYEILSSYIYQHHRERHATVCTIGNGEQLKYYIEYTKECKLFPEAKPMETYGVLEKEYYGERIAMMMAYYDEFLKQYPIYSCHAHSLRDYCLSLGWDLAIYIHRYIRQPMDWQVYHDLKDMVLRKMTKDEYLAYRSKADYITDRGKEGYFDGWGNKIGNTYGEASKVLESRAVITFEQAIEEVKQFNWSL